MMKKIFLLCVILLTCTSCSEFAILATGTTIAVAQNSYSKAYNSSDILTIMYTEKDIKRHTYERIREVIQERD